MLKKSSKELMLSQKVGLGVHNSEEQDPGNHTVVDITRIAGISRALIFLKQPDHLKRQATFLERCHESNKLYALGLKQFIFHKTQDKSSSSIISDQIEKLRQMLLDHHTDRVDKIRELSSVRVRFLEIESLIDRYIERCFVDSRRDKDENMYELDLIQIKMILSRTVMNRRKQLEDPDYEKKKNERMTAMSKDQITVLEAKTYSLYACQRKRIIDKKNKIARGVRV